MLGGCVHREVREMEGMNRGLRKERKKERAGKAKER